MNTNNWPNNDVRNYVPTQRNPGLGNKTLFTTSVKKGNTEVRYFSGTDAEIYFDEIYVDEVVQIQYQVQQNTMPLYGYNSYVYDQVARGSRLINGSFTVNFTQAEYLYRILNELSEKPTSNDMSVNKDNEGTLSEFDANENSSGKSKLSMNSQHGPMWNKSFEIILSYGDARQQASGPNSTMLALTGVVLTGCSQELGINGEPVYETYSFIARDITTSIANISSEESTPSITKDDSVITIDELTYIEGFDDWNTKPYGVINLSYTSSFPIETVKMQLLIPLESEVGMVKLVDNNKTDKNTKISYRVSDEWREGIKSYCKASMKTAMEDASKVAEALKVDPFSSLNPYNIVNQGIPTSLKVDMIFEYQVNGSTTTKPMSGKLKIKNVFTQN